MAVVLKRFCFMVELFKKIGIDDEIHISILPGICAAAADNQAFSIQADLVEHLPYTEDEDF